MTGPNEVLILKRVLVPLDGSALAESALPALMNLLPAADLDIHLCEVVSDWLTTGVYPGWGPIGEWGEIVPDTDEGVREAENYLRRVAERLVGSHVTTTVRVGIPAHAIVDEIRVIKPDLVAMATHGRGGMARAVMGSVTDLVLRASAVPVLVVHPRPAETENRP